MSIELPLGTMTLADKLAVMEMIWADLSRQPSDLPSPTWHREVLEARRCSADSGTLKFSDWEVAFAELRKELHEDSSSRDR